MIRVARTSDAADGPRDPPPVPVDPTREPPPPVDEPDPSPDPPSEPNPDESREPPAVLADVYPARRNEDGWPSVG